jgi:hypothetical protein
VIVRTVAGWRTHCAQLTSTHSYLLLRKADQFIVMAVAGQSGQEAGLVRLDSGAGADEQVWAQQGCEQ